MYKIVAIDLDGTLLNSFGEITPNTKEVLKKAINKGVQIVLASGRPVSAIENIASEIGSDEYLISGNGALVYDINKLLLLVTTTAKFILWSVNIWNIY